MRTLRLTMAQALAQAMAAQHVDVRGETVPIFGGVWAIFGHGNVAGMGEALFGVHHTLPTFRAHNEQAMAHAAIAFAKASRRRRMMACTTSIGPGATNLVTAAAVAHVNRLPVLLLPGDVFASRRPDPVLQQLEDFSDATVTANDCLRPVSRYFDRLTRPEQLIGSFAQAMAVLTDPAQCGPVTLALCQDVQAEAYDFPASMFENRVWSLRRPQPDEAELTTAAAMLKAARKPFVIAGGGGSIQPGRGRPDGLLRGPRTTRWRDPGRQIQLAKRPRLKYGRGRRERDDGGKRLGVRSRPDRGRGNAVARLHHWVAHPVQRQ